MQKWAPVKFVCSTASQSSFFMRIARPSRVTAALFTRISSRPNFSTTCLNPAFTCSASATSIFTASASPPADTISPTSAANFSSFRAATTTFAPASANALAVSRPIPCDAPVTTATLSFKLNIPSAPLRHPKKTCHQRQLQEYRTLSDLCLLPSRCVELRPGNLVQRDRQTLLVFHVQRRHGSLNLPQQSCQHAPRAHFHKRVHAFINQHAHGFFPTHRHRHLPHQRIPRLSSLSLSVRIDIRHQRPSQIRKLRRRQILRQPFLSRHHQRRMKWCRHRQNHR